MGKNSKSKAFPYRWSKIIRDYESFWIDLRQESRIHPFGQVKVPDLLVGDPRGIFSHYPSRCVFGQDTLSLTKTGRQLLNSPEILMRYEDIQGCIFPELEHFILSSLVQGPQTLEALRQLAGKVLGATNGQVDFQTLWLLKHGVLTLNSTL